MTDQIKYDAEIIREFAWKMYRKAGDMVIAGTLLGALGGAVLGMVMGSVDAAFMLGLVGLFVGMAFAKHAAFKLKLQAQLALCQVQIEENTRATTVDRKRIFDPKPANTNAA